MTARPALLAWDAGEVGDRRQDLPVIAGVGRRRVHHERHSVFVHDERVLYARFPAVNGTLSRGIAAAEGSDHDAVDDRQLGLEDADLPEQCEKTHMEIIPRPVLVPSSKPSVSGAARTAEFERHIFQPTTGHQHVPEDVDHGKVRNSWSTALTAYRFLRGKQALQFAKNASGIRAPAILAPSMGHETMTGPCANHVPNEVLSEPITSPMDQETVRMSVDLVEQREFVAVFAAPPKALGST